MVRRGLRVAGVSLLSLAMIGATPASALPLPGDGVVTPEVCSALGFPTDQVSDVRVSGVMKHARCCRKSSRPTTVTNRLGSGSPA